MFLVFELIDQQILVLGGDKILTAKIRKAGPKLFADVPLIRKLKLIPKFMTSQAGQQIVKIHISPNISRSKSNQTMKFRQLIEYNVRKTFPQKPCRK